MMNPNSTQKQQQKQANTFKHHQRSAFKAFKKPLIKQAWLSSSKKQKNNRPKFQKDYSSQSVLKCMTVGIVLKYKQCSPNFQYNSQLHPPRRILTKPSEPAGNNDYDNIENNLLLAANDVLNGRFVRNIFSVDIFF